MLKTKKLNAVVAIEIILSMTLYYFVLLGFTAITYAIDLVQTNNHNIDFLAYFIDENGQKTNIAQKSINEKEYLYVDVIVKNEGYFNGYISLNNNNFNVVQDIQSEGIEEISGNTVKLKQINSGSAQTIKLLVEPVKHDKINRISFNGNTEVVLSGDYTYSKNIEAENKAEISGIATVQLLWKSSQEILPEIEANLLTNSIYELNGEQKIVVQLLINSKIKNNEYPVNKTTIKINGLKNAEQVKVFARSTNATNEELVFTENNYEYDKINNTLTINVDNNFVDTISWKKECKDTFVVTYVLDKDEDISNQNILVNGSIITYDQKILESNCNIKINEQKDGIVTSDLAVKESAIFKGKLYTGEERTYYTASQIHMNYCDLINKVMINEKASVYLQNEIEFDANIVYNSATINKDNFNKILGENGYITIKDENGVLIGNINNTTPIDANGNLTTNYNTEVRNLIIETSKPIKEGTLNIIHSKTIKNTNLSREIINSLTGIKETSNLIYNDNYIIGLDNKTIELRNTSSKAKLEVEPIKLTAVHKNENVKMTVVLENSDEARDLYQNPVVKIKLPTQVKSINAKCKMMYNNGLEITNAHIYKENENHILEIDLQGTQTTYNTGVVDGTTIIIYADIEIDENAVNCNDEFTMSYTNEIATSFEDNGEEKVGIQVEGIPEEIKAMLAEQNVRALAAQEQLTVGLKGYVGGQELTNGDTVYTGEIIRYEVTLENSTSADIDNITLQAMIPDGTKCVERYVDEETLEDKYREIQLDNNMLTNTIERISCLNNNKVFFEYEIRVDEDTDVGSILSRLTTNYENKTINNELRNNVEKAEVSLVTLMHSRFGETINDGNDYSYEINVKNITNTDLNNVEISVLTNSAYKVEGVLDLTNDTQLSESGEFLIDNLPAGQTKTYRVITKVERGNQNYATIYAIANNKVRSNYISERIETSSIIAQLDSDNKNARITTEDSIIYKLTIQNNGDVSQNGVYIKQSISKYCDVISVTLNGQNMEFNKTNDNQSVDEENKDNYFVEYKYLGVFNPGEKLNIAITIKPYDIEHTKDINLTSYAMVNDINTDTIVHILANNTEEPIKPEPDDQQYDDVDDETDPTIDEKDDEDNKQDDEGNTDNDDNGNGKGDGNNNNNNESSDGANGNSINSKYSISGRVWLDENENGQRDSNEKDVNDVQITLLNVDTKETQNITNNGVYKFNDLDNGRYIAIFEYDTNKYNLTKYQAENVSKDLNSDVEKNKITFEEKEQVLATTDILNVTNGDITNIDLGLVNTKNFDLELTKTISKITISNTEGKTTKEYNDSQLAKVEIGAKYLKNSTVVIEYSIKVKNAGEMAGYATQIVDFKPTDLQFNSSLNSDWYQSGEYIYSNALEKTKIEPGETKEVRLILTKQMTESNIGLTNNMAEINKSISINNTNDSDSIQGNKKSGEDDLGQANVIIGVKTGAAISYILVSISILAMTLLGALFINKIIQKIDD